MAAMTTRVDGLIAHADEVATILSTLPKARQSCLSRSGHFSPANAGIVVTQSAHPPIALHAYASG
jgi:hypothetical protein